jgi:hypothetical protein
LSGFQQSPQREDDFWPPLKGEKIPSFLNSTRMASPGKLDELIDSSLNAAGMQQECES